ILTEYASSDRQAGRPDEVGNLHAPPCVEPCSLECRGRGSHTEDWLLHPIDAGLACHHVGRRGTLEHAQSRQPDGPLGRIPVSSQASSWDSACKRLPSRSRLSCQGRTSARALLSSSSPSSSAVPYLRR